ncbi:uncharacterized protein LOC133839579 isoform X3 [Drosophila sulfurigaster albostrigata]|uniref:uncharacterized protein LOC133839579 isoform X3 n=1 Tax=Drosophila sulfurigaster albostrigata TaxID=89887 RepID=UPI002D21A181|nr:uncharacterized protein LOC133839579 isoform X3 [Drosophila sulfurigaster albostrigata]
MFYLQNFLFIFSLRFGCRLIAYTEICAYGYGVYYMFREFGFIELMESMIIISLGTSCILAILMLVSTLQEHESTGIIFTYLMWGIFTTIFLAIFYILSYTNRKMESIPLFVALLLSSVMLC